MTAEEQVTSAIEDAQDTDDSVELSDDQKAEMAAEIEDGKVEEIK